MTQEWQFQLQNSTEQNHGSKFRKAVHKIFTRTKNAFTEKYFGLPYELNFKIFIRTLVLTAPTLAVAACLIWVEDQNAIAVQAAESNTADI